MIENDDGLPQEALPRLIYQLGYAGVFPFIGALVFLVLSTDPIWKAWAVQASMSYAAIIITFLGAVHWGRLFDPALPLEQGKRLAIYGVIPSILAWLSTLLEPNYALPLQAILIGFVFFVDKRLIHEQSLAAWYLPLRQRLTSMVVVLLLITWAVEQSGWQI